MNRITNSLKTSLAAQALAVALVFALAGAVAISFGIVRGQNYHSQFKGLSAWNVAPPNIGDQYDYLNIGLAFSKGRGYSTDYTDPDFRRPLEKAKAAGYGGFDTLLASKSTLKPTAYRMPGYPLALAIIFKMTGYNFVGPRALNCLLIGLMAMFVFLTASRLLTRKAAFIAVAILFLNPLMWVFVRMIVTEIMAMTFAAAAFFFLVKSVKNNGGTADIFFCGTLISLGVLTRGALTFFIPFFALAIFLAASISIRKRIILSALFCIVAILPLLPWIWRNNEIGGGNIGLCTQSGIDMPGGYTEVCLKSGGFWANYKLQPYADEMIAARKQGGEWAACRKGREIFWRIIRENPGIVPKLVAVKMQKMLLPNPVTHLNIAGYFCLLMLAYAGLFVMKRQDILLLLAPVAGVVSCCVVFYADERYALPMAPALAILAAAFVFWAGTKLHIFELPGAPASDKN